eukprot:5110613-Amphidinium_carterae.1
MAMDQSNTRQERTARVRFQEAVLLSTFSTTFLANPELTELLPGDDQGKRQHQEMLTFLRKSYSSLCRGPFGGGVSSTMAAVPFLRVQRAWLPPCRRNTKTSTQKQ